MLRHLDARRNKLEASLTQMLPGDETADVMRLAALKGQLEPVSFRPKRVPRGP